MINLHFPRVVFLMGSRLLWGLKFESQCWSVGGTSLPTARCQVLFS
jgi:hypothetical protein